MHGSLAIGTLHGSDIIMHWIKRSGNETNTDLESVPVLPMVVVSCVYMECEGNQIMVVIMTINGHACS